MLRKEQVAAGRIWLLLKYLDDSGRGWISVAAARDSLSRKNAELRVCGWRQMRKLLARGEGLFWRRAGDRIWLRSAAKVAAALGVVRLSGSPVAFPVDTLLQGIGDARAHLFATFHSSRVPISAVGATDKLIARKTLRDLSSAGLAGRHRLNTNVEPMSNAAPISPLAVDATLLINRAVPGGTAGRRFDFAMKPAGLAKKALNIPPGSYPTITLVHMEDDPKDDRNASIESLQTCL
jgi:hypothetical protein